MAIDRRPPLGGVRVKRHTGAAASAGRVEGRDRAGVGDRVAGRAQEIEAIEPIRGLAAHGSGAVRGEAVKALGVFGCPQDYDFLVEGLESADPADACNFAYAIYEYGDLRAVPHLIGLLSTDNQRLGEEVVAGLAHFSTPDSIEAIHHYGESGKASDLRKVCDRELAEVMKLLGVTYEAYAGKSPDERAKLLSSLRDRMEETYRLKPGDRKLTHDELLKAAVQWIKPGSGDGDYDWVKDRHVMAAATAADIPLLLDVAAGCYARLSEESLDEAHAPGADRRAPRPNALP